MVRTSIASTFFVLLAACGGGGGGGAGGNDNLPPSLFPPGVTAQDLVAAEYVDAATDLAYVLLGDTAGRGQIEVTDLPITSGGFVDTMEWSPTHGHLAILANPDGVTDTVLFVVDPLTGDVATVSGPQTPGTFVSSFQWSPDGQFLAFNRIGLGGGPLFTVRADGSDLLEVSDPLVAGGNVGQFAWSPDSTRLAITMDAETDDIQEVFVVARDGSGRVKVSGSGGAAGSSSDRILWSPDGSRVAYLSNLGGGSRADLFVSLATGVGGRVRVNPVLPAGGFIFAFQWAPDGSRIAYVAEQNADDLLELFTSLPDTTGNVRVSGTLVTGGDVQGDAFLWAPDASRIAFLADAATDEVVELFTVVPDGAAAPVRVSGPLVAGGDVSGRIVGPGDFVWSPDSTHIAYVADADVDGTEEVFVTVPTAASAVRVSTSLVAGAEVDNGMSWSADSQHLLYLAEHLVATPQDFLSPIAGPAIALFDSDGQEVRAGEFSFPGDRVVFVADPAPDASEVRSLLATTLEEEIVVVPPRPSDLDDLEVR
jgi:Tol biopolymer transport system component